MYSTKWNSPPGSKDASGRPLASGAPAGGDRDQSLFVRRQAQLGAQFLVGHQGATESLDRRERERRVAPDLFVLPLGDEHRAQDRADRAVAVAQVVSDGPLAEFFDRVVGEWAFEQGVVMFNSFRCHCHYFWRDIPPRSRIFPPAKLGTGRGPEKTPGRRRRVAYITAAATQTDLVDQKSKAPRVIFIARVENLSRPFVTYVSETGIRSQLTKRIPKDSKGRRHYETISNSFGNLFRAGLSCCFHG